MYVFNIQLDTFSRKWMKWKSIQQHQIHKLGKPPGLSIESDGMFCKQIRSHIRSKHNINLILSYAGFELLCCVLLSIFFPRWKTQSITSDQWYELSLLVLLFTEIRFTSYIISIDWSFDWAWMNFPFHLATHRLGKIEMIDSTSMQNSTIGTKFFVLQHFCK